MIIDGKKVSEKILLNIKNEVENLSFPVTLTVIQIGEDEASNIYINQKKKVASSLGINFNHIKFKDNVLESEIKNTIIELNNDENISGIIIQLPIPNKYNVDNLINTIDPIKDVDGLTDINRIKLINNEDTVVPCTPRGILELLKYYNISLEGKDIVIIGRSKLVSKPLFSLLLNNNATVTMCHSKTKDISKYTRNSDIVISAVGKKHLIKKDMVMDDSVIIDVGISRVDGKLYGDTDFDNIVDKASYITPVPGGVGPMTVAMLMKNTVDSAKKIKRSMK